MQEIDASLRRLLSGKGKPQTVVSGFYSDDEKRLYGAPVGLTQDRDGALLIADDVGNVVWRVTGDTH
jgi:glucose/arabinose dehydrogenase